MSTESLEEALVRERRTVFGDAPADDVLLEKLAAVAERASPAELSMLESSEAREVYLAAQTFARERAPAPRSWAARLWWAPAGVAVAALLVFVMPSAPEDEPGFIARGVAPKRVREFDVLRIESGGPARPFEAGGAFGRDQRFGFAYREVGENSRSISIVAFDGEKIDWLYPEVEDAAAGFELDPRLASAGVRLPFDFQLDPDLRPGKVLIVAGFDLAPAELKRVLEDGSYRTHPRVRVLELMKDQEVSP